MTRKAKPGQPLFDFLYIDAADVQRYPQALEDMIAGRLDGMIIRGVLSPEAAAGVSARLERSDHTLPKSKFPAHAELEDAPHVLGEAIVSTEASMSRYFDAAEAFRGECRALFAGFRDFEACVEATLSALAGGRPVAIPSGPRGETYTSATIRVLPEGHEIGVHVGNEFLRLPQAKHLLDLLEPADQLSYFATLSVPDCGGELVVYGLEWEDVAPFLPPHEGGPAGVYAMGSPVFELAESYEKMAFRPDPGDLLIFNGGRYYHRVSPVVGRNARRTIGGFLGFSRERDRVLYWS